LEIAYGEMAFGLYIPGTPWIECNVCGTQVPEPSMVSHLSDHPRCMKCRLAFISPYALSIHKATSNCYIPERAFNDAIYKYRKYKHKVTIKDYQDYQDMSLKKKLTPSTDVDSEKKTMNEYDDFRLQNQEKTVNDQHLIDQQTVSNLLSAMKEADPCFKTTVGDQLVLDSSSVENLAKMAEAIVQNLKEEEKSLMFDKNDEASKITSNKMTILKLNEDLKQAEVAIPKDKERCKTQPTESHSNSLKNELHNKTYHQKDRDCEITTEHPKTVNTDSSDNFFDVLFS